jgi:TolB protein
MIFHEKWLLPVIFLTILSTTCTNDNPVENDNSQGHGGPDTQVLSAYFDSPAWHPGGKWIAASHTDSIDTNGDSLRDRLFSGIWLVHAESGETRPLIAGFDSPDWSPDGTRLVMERGGQIFTIRMESLELARIDSSSLAQLTTEGRNFYPAWSADGEWIAYDNTDCGSSFEPPPSNSCGVLIMNLKNKSRRFVSLYSRMPSWHPFEQKILLVNRAVLQTGDVLGDSIWVYDLAEKKNNFLVFLSGLNYDNRHPKYSPDGTTIAFYSQPQERPPALWLMNSDGSNPRKMSPDHARSFDWSPDGAKLVFVYLDIYEPVEGNGQLWVINSDGSGLRQLTHFTPSSSYLPW